jgi:AbrB family looped-hinge helix DNA binding protein
VETTRLSTKGQIILPKSIRESRAWGPGTEFVVEEAGDGVLLRPARLFPQSTLEEVIGCLRPRRKPPTDAQIRTAVHKELKRRRESGRY